MIIHVLLPVAHIHRLFFIFFGWRLCGVDYVLFTVAHIDWLLFAV